MSQIALLELDFSTGTRRYSFDGVRPPSPGHYYADKIKEMGEVSYEIDLLGNAFRIGDLDVRLDNSDLEFSILRSQATFYNIEARVLFGDEDDGLAAMNTLMRGFVSKWEINRENRVCNLTLTDVRTGRFHKRRLAKILKVLNEVDYPNLPDNIKRGQLIPLPYGELISTADLPVGQIPAFLVDPAVGVGVYRYALAQCELQSVEQVYRYGVPWPTPTITFTGGVTYLDFTSDQRAYSDYFARDFDQLVISTNLIHRWLFNEGTGTTVNDDVSTADATLQGTSAWTVPPASKPFRTHPYVVFGDTGSLTFGTPSSILNLTGDFTVAFWAERGLFPDGGGSEETIFNCGEVLDTKGWRFYIEPTLGHYVLRTNTSGANQKTETKITGWAFNDSIEGRFSHYAVRKASGVVSIFVNGTDAGSLGGSGVFPYNDGYVSRPTHTAPVASDQTVRFSDSTNTYVGGIVNLRIHSSALTDAEIQRLFNISFTSFTRQNENEITADVKGITSGSPATLIENPVLQLRDLLEKLGVEDSEVNDTMFTEVAAQATARGLVGAGALVEADMTVEDAVNQIEQSFNLSLIADEDSKYGVVLLHAFDFSSPDTSDHFVDAIDILKDSFRQEGPEEVASSLRYNFMLNWYLQEFEQRLEKTDSPQITALGEDILYGSELDQWYVRDETLAETLGEEKLKLLQEGRVFSNFALPMTLSSQHLGKLIRVTHVDGVASTGDGFEAAVHRICGLSFSLNPLEQRFTVRALKALDSEL